MSGVVRAWRISLTFKRFTYKITRQNAVLTHTVPRVCHNFIFINKFATCFFGDFTRRVGVIFSRLHKTVVFFVPPSGRICSHKHRCSTTFFNLTDIFVSNKLFVVLNAYVSFRLIFSTVIYTELNKHIVTRVHFCKYSVKSAVVVITLWTSSAHCTVFNNYIVIKIIGKNLSPTCLRVYLCIVVSLCRWITCNIYSRFFGFFPCR